MGEGRERMMKGRGRKEEKEGGRREEGTEGKGREGGRERGRNLFPHQSNMYSWSKSEKYPKNENHTPLPKRKQALCILAYFQSLINMSTAHVS